MYLVVKHENGRDVGIDHDGERHADLNHAELMSESRARETAQKYGGALLSDERAFPHDFYCDDE